jgi:serine/threonine protein kinase
MTDSNPNDLSVEALVLLLDAALRVGTSAAPPEVPDWWNDPAFPYVTVAYIGRGGSGLVWKASRRDGHGLVALKLVPFRSDPVRLQQRWQDECAALARIDHPNLVGLIDHGRSPDGLSGWLAMEWIEGTCLGRKLAEEGQIAFQEIRSIIPQAVAGLQALHSAGLVHRDIKPSNLLLEKDTARLVIADLGIVHDLDGDPDQRVTRTYEQALTPGYFPPEMLQPGYRPDAAGDQYSLAFTLWQLLTGTMPLGAFGKLHQLCKCPDAVDAVLRRALATDPSQRHPSLDSFSQAFQKAAIRPPRNFIILAFFMLSLIAVCAFLLTRPPTFPKRFHSGKITGFESPGQSMEIDLTLRQNGTFTGQVHTMTTDALLGFAGRSWLTFRDERGNVIHRLRTHGYGVNGLFIPGAENERVDEFEAHSVTPDIARRVHTIDFAPAPGDKTQDSLARENQIQFQEDVAALKTGLKRGWKTLSTMLSSKPPEPLKESGTTETGGQ